MACSIGNVQDTGMEGSKSFDVTVTGADLTGLVEVRSCVRDAADVPSDQTVVPEDAMPIGQVNSGVAHCAVMTGCTAGRVILAWPIKTNPGTRGSFTV